METNSNSYDAIIVGGGHNGLVCGAFFARSGAKTVVLESRKKAGGAADTSAPFPDHPEIQVSTYSYVMSLMPPTVINELPTTKPIRMAARFSSSRTITRGVMPRSRSSLRRTPRRSRNGKPGSKASPMSWGLS